MKLAVITDTSATINEKYKIYDNLHILDIPLTIDGVTYSSKTTASEEFFEKMATSSTVPKSAQPSLPELETLLQNLEAQGYTHVLGLFLTSQISGFYQNAYYLQDETKTMVVKFPETSITSTPLGYMVETALESAKSGASFDAILAEFETQRDCDRAYMLVDDLKWLSKSGRLSGGSAFFGTLLNVKPVLTFTQEGKIVVQDKVRTAKKSITRLKELLVAGANPELDKVYIMQAAADDKAHELYVYALEQGFKDVEVVPFGAVVATHLGLGSLAYAWIRKHEI
ncbi:MAG: DegV family protein [Streptococcaceae bacterium]|jgi:DegV family protein with EDD domain|nr:DegV family protein [Streptococcaceae bacterium]